MHGLYLLWWVQEKDVSPAAVAAILAAGDLVLLAVELPTGWFADRFGHRTSLLSGSLLQVAGMLWCWLGEGIAGLVTASVLVALGDGFRSGACEALLYRSCVALDREDDFQRIQGRTHAFESASLVALVLAGGFIVSAWGFAAGWIAETALCAAGAGVAWAMTEPPAAAEDTGAPEHRSHRARALPLALGAIVLPAAILGGLATVASFLAQTSGRFDAVSVSLLVALASLGEAAGSAAATKLPARGPGGGLLLAALGAGLFGAALAAPSALLVLVPAISLLDGLAGPLRATLIQRAAHDGARARMASLASACDMAVSTIALPIAGVARTRRR